jgi:hypothetical protein
MVVDVALKNDEYMERMRIGRIMEKSIKSVVKMKQNWRKSRSEHNLQPAAGINLAAGRILCSSLGGQAFGDLPGGALLCRASETADGNARQVNWKGRSSR